MGTDSAETRNRGEPEACRGNTVSHIIKKARQMPNNDIVALAAVVISIGTNVALYIHLSSTMNARFDSVDRRLEALTGKVVEIDNRLTRLEVRMGIHG